MALDLTLTVNKADVPSLDRVVVCDLGNQKCYTSIKELVEVLHKTEAGLDYIVINGRQFLREYQENHKCSSN
jgi:hypothetical protein